MPTYCASPPETLSVFGLELAIWILERVLMGDLSVTMKIGKLHRYMYICMYMYMYILT